MTIKGKLTYVTSDGTEFVNRSEAVEYERAMVIEGIFQSNQNYDDVRLMELTGYQGRQIAEFVASQFEEINRLFKNHDLL